MVSLSAPAAERSAPDPSILVGKTTPSYAPRRAFKPWEVFPTHGFRDGFKDKNSWAAPPQQVVDAIAKMKSTGKLGTLFGPKKAGRDESSEPKPKPGDPNYVDPNWPLL